MDRDDHTARAPGEPARSLSLLLVQLGFLTARRFGARLGPVGLEPRHVGLLHALAADEGQSQQAVSARLDVATPRLVGLVDELEARGLVERRRSPTDRRANALFLTDAGREALARTRSLAAEHEDDLLAALGPDEREQLRALLTRVADHHGVTSRAFPGPPFAGGPWRRRPR